MLIISGVYCFTQISTGKKYIGCSKNIWQRYGQHYSWAFSDNALTNNKKFYLELRECPTDFKFEILEECEEEKLRIREGYYITLYDSFNNGFNDRNDYTDILYAYDKNYNLVGTYNTVADAIAELNLPSSAQGNIWKAYMNKIASAYGYIWCRGETIQDKKKTLTASNKGKKKTVYVYDLQGNLLDTCESQNLAAIKFGLKQSAISACCNGKSNTVHGYRFTYNLTLWGE